MKLLVGLFAPIKAIASPFPGLMVPFSAALHELLFARRSSFICFAGS